MGMPGDARVVEHHQAVCSVTFGLLQNGFDQTMTTTTGELAVWLVEQLHRAHPESLGRRFQLGCTNRCQASLHAAERRRLAAGEAEHGHDAVLICERGQQGPEPERFVVRVRHHGQRPLPLGQKASSNLGVGHIRQMSGSSNHSISSNSGDTRTAVLGARSGDPARSKICRASSR